MNRLRRENSTSCPYNIYLEDVPSYGVEEGIFIMLRRAAVVPSRVWAGIPSLFAALLVNFSHYFHYYSYARIRRQQKKEKNTSMMINKSGVETQFYHRVWFCPAPVTFVRFKEKEVIIRSIYRLKIHIHRKQCQRMRQMSI